MVSESKVVSMVEGHFVHIVARHCRETPHPNPLPQGLRE